LDQIESNFSLQKIKSTKKECPEHEFVELKLVKFENNEREENHWNFGREE